VQMCGALLVRLLISHAVVLPSRRLCGDLAWR
jgi:hypothetical protein